MLKIEVTEIAFTAYPITDVPKARAFYEGLLGLKPTMLMEDAGCVWIEYDIGAATLAITNMAADKWKPSPDGPSVALEVADFPAAMQVLREAAVPIMMDSMESPGCFLSVISDPSGNTVTIHKRKAH